MQYPCGMREFFMFFVNTFITVKMITALLLCGLTIAFIVLPVVFLVLRWKYAKLKARENRTKLKVGLFHPYCNAGGGGEKVLWVAIQSLRDKYPDAELYVYTGDVEVTPTEILERVNKNLNVRIDKSIKFIYLHRRRWVEAAMYPYFTLLGQSLGSVFLGFEALKQLNPDIFVDTTGFAFTLPLFKYIAGSKTACYVHYPTITTEMLKRVTNRRANYNNRNIIARSPFLTTGKLYYYKIFAWLYSLAGQCSDITMVNSTFTLEHLNNLWNRPLYLVYPPCDVDHFKKMSREKNRPKKIRILSLAQFRPEKDHALQLQTLYELREILPEDLFSNITLVLCGSCRNQDDTNRVKDLKDLSKHLSVEDNVEFRVNVTFEELLKEFKSAYIGIHTMMDEHFGIGIVELMASGLVAVAHRSGGPLLDIIETSEASRLGFLAVTAEEYAHTIKFILYLSDEEVEDVRIRAKASVDRFSTKKFKEEFLRAIEPLFKK